MSGPTYLREHANCACGRKSVGKLYGRQNEHYGDYCRACARREIAATERRERRASDTRGQA